MPDEKPAGAAREPVQAGRLHCKAAQDGQENAGAAHAAPDLLPFFAASGFVLRIPAKIGNAAFLLNCMCKRRISGADTKQPDSRFLNPDRMKSRNSFHPDR
ncbi:hypothetical protein [Yeguia hominis]|uniref:Uncharacterized protein n=1 Tax=Yeguia hominis TaxID=2763662 RepID=A0A926D861_9FIRM|nr:hypothetical protein [Yeguia hominis]MBC8533173.1 hypothetical protein [Yeguia hominis]